MSTANESTAKLARQPLRIPGGWAVEHNELRQLHPSTLNAGDPLWNYLVEDLLQVHHVRRKLLLDVGWYPDSQPEGCFQMILLRNKDWDNPLRMFKTKELSELVQQIEEWLLRPVP